MTLLKRGAFLLVVAAFGVTLAACENTVRGVGRDMQQTGEAVEDTMQGNP